MDSETRGRKQQPRPDNANLTKRQKSYRKNADKEKLKRRERYAKNKLSKVPQARKPPWRKYDKEIAQYAAQKTYTQKPEIKERRSRQRLVQLTAQRAKEKQLKIANGSYVPPGRPRKGGMHMQTTRTLSPLRQSQTSTETTATETPLSTSSQSKSPSLRISARLLDKKKHIISINEDVLARNNDKRGYEFEIMKDSAFGIFQLSDDQNTIIHGIGVTAVNKINSNTHLMDYSGDVIKTEDHDKREEEYENNGIQEYYFFKLGRTKMIDATKTGNIARFINHSCSPNCEAVLASRAGKIQIWATEDIQPGTELTLDYNIDRQNVLLPCSCKSPKCRTYMNNPKLFIKN